MDISFVDIKTGSYEAVLEKIIEGNSKFGQYLQFCFIVTEGNLKNYKFSGFVNYSFLKKSKLYKWITKILGREPEDYFSTDQLIGKKCFIAISKTKSYYSVIDVSDEPPF